MKKMQYISPACEVLNVNVQNRFLGISSNWMEGEGGTIGTKPGDANGDDFDVKGEGGFWDEW